MVLVYISELLLTLIRSQVNNVTIEVLKIQTKDKDNDLLKYR